MWKFISYKLTKRYVKKAVSTANNTMQAEAQGPYSPWNKNFKTSSTMANISNTANANGETKKSHP